MKKTLLLGIDMGTGGCKVTFTDSEGVIVHHASREYSSHHPLPGWSEQNPADWIQAFLEALKNAAAHPDVDLCQVLCVAISASTHNAVLLDEKMSVIRPVIMWTDQRSVRETECLEQNHGRAIFDIGFQKVSPTWTLPQLLWIKNNEPRAFEKIRRILFVKDYLRYSLTDVWGTDVIDAQGTLLFDMKKSVWSDVLCSMIPLPVNVLPPLHQPTDIIGKITPEAARKTGLPAGTPVIAGSSDSAIEDYAAGALEPGDCVLKLATAGNVNVMTARPCPHPQTLTYSHIIPDLWYTVSATNSAASAQRWLRDVLNLSFETMEQLADKIPAGSGGLIFHPYLLGERSPYWNPHLRASFTGLHMSHSQGHLCRALMEGVAFSLRDCLQPIHALGIDIKKFILIGGGARSRLWRRIVCDVFGQDIHVPEQCDASFGAALLAGVGAGIFKDVRAAVQKTLKTSEKLTPNPDLHKQYSALFDKYRKMQASLAPFYGQ
ncbi:MAG: xylulokinase [Verrucomicrobiae bacterium]|nr:xylulokinase [Verrucomicrobiae bacterium]